jgi:homoserine dehydrogenase
VLFALERPLARGRITCLQSVLSGACNVILENMVEGADLEEAIADAVKRGITEPDPELDVSGWDTAQKLTILLTRAVGLRYTPEEIEVIGLRGIDPALVRAAEKRELRVKLVGLCEWGPELLQATVRPVAVPAESHLGSVRGENHVVVLRTRETGEMVYFGEGAGTLPVATAVLNDLLGVFDPGHSWTGRFPPAVEKTQAPSFDRHLVLEKGRARVVTEAAEGSVPVLDLCDGAATNREPEPS